MTTCPVPRPARRKLPVWQTVGDCYATVARNLGQLVRIGWLWLLIMIPVYAALLWLHRVVEEDVVLLEWQMDLALRGWDAAAAAAAVALDYATVVVTFVSLVVESSFLASIAVAWHRLLLRQERVTAAAYLRLDRRVWLYALYSLLLALLTALLAICAVLVANQDSLMWTTVAVLGGLGTMLLLLGIQTLGQAMAVLAAVAAVLLVLPRLSLVLPALALGERLSPEQAWRISRANTLRVGLATFLCALPALVPTLAFLWWAWTGGSDQSQAAYVVRQVVHSLCYAVLVIFGVTLLSLAYRFFTARQGEPAASAA
jgi:hypothetical protein